MATDAFKAARDFLLAHRTDYDAAVCAISAGRTPDRSTGRWTGSMRNWRAATAATARRCGSSAPARRELTLPRAVARAPTGSPTACARWA